MKDTEQVFVRDVTLEDEEVLYRFNLALSERPLSREAFSVAFRTNVTAGSNKYLIAEIEGVPVGMGSCHVQWLLHHASPMAEVQELYVSPEFRSRGVGALLLQTLEAFARSKGADQVELSTNKKRIDAHRFYSSQGYHDSHLKWVKK